MCDEPRADQQHRIRSFLPLSPQTFHVLLSLIDTDRHGYGVAQAVEEETEGRLRLAAGTLYGIIKRCTEEGLIREVDGPRDNPGGERRRYYQLTPIGLEVARSEANRLDRLVETARSKRLLVAESAR